MIIITLVYKKYYSINNYTLVIYIVVKIKFVFYPNAFYAIINNFDFDY